MHKYITSFNSDGSRYDRLDNFELSNKDCWLLCKYNKVDESLTIILNTYLDNPELIYNILNEIKHTIACGGWT